MPLVRPGGATWSLPVDDALPPSSSTTTEKGGKTTGQYTLDILERYLSTFDAFETSSNSKYNNNSDGGGGGLHTATAADSSLFSEALERLSEHVTGDANGMAACLICLEDVKPTDPIWHCTGRAATTTAAALPCPNQLDSGGVDNDNNDDSTGCYTLLHLPCAQAWARQQIQQQQQKQKNQRNTNCWGCPKCRKLYSTVPLNYSCFCGKVENPVFNPWHVAHSCGEECAVKNPSCGHPCMLLCHPGPHPPCPRAVQSSCYCGKEMTSRRCGKQEFSCNSVCGRKRSINFNSGEANISSKMHCSHPCPALCHPGDCPPCIRLVSASCRCGSTTATEMRCSAVSDFRCEKICNKLLSCGEHSCSQICCDGACGPCPFSIRIKTCPCGKTEERNIECGGTVPPCGQTCDKVLSCGVHHCAERCHTGPCPQTCRTTVEKTCLCGRMTRTILCQENFKCERRCIEMKSCGRHPCKRRCCDGTNCPPCEEVCNKRLRCGNHRCPAPCHSGECSPCPLTIKISCACGKTSYTTPCGRESTAKQPRCQLACSVPATCRHRGGEFPPHRCHFGACPGEKTTGENEKVPSCPFPCGSALNCGHSCSFPCHDPPCYVEISPFASPPAPIAPGERDVSKKRIEQLNAPPAAVPAVRAAMAFLAEQERSKSALLSECPPCGLIQQVTCLGGHTTAAVPCSQALPFSCEKNCGAVLTCENHTCSLACHDINTNPCVQCSLPCQKQRPCKHSCPHPDANSSGGGTGSGGNGTSTITISTGMCHPGDCGDCQVEVLLPCHCAKTSLSFPCYRTTATPITENFIKSNEMCCPKQCLKQLAKCPHLCEFKCHEGPCPGSIGRCEAETTVRCSCKRLKKKLPCFEVAALLEKQRKEENGGGGKGAADGTFDALTSLRLLPCDAECCKATITTNSTTKSVGNGQYAKSATAAAAAANNATIAPSGLSLRLEGQKKRFLQDERAAETARKERDREQKRLEKIKQQRMKQLIRIFLLFMLFVVVFGGAFLLRRVLTTVDRRAHEHWGNKRQQ
jgi:NF-X1-type zinc finger protein NFXL1